MSVFNHYNQVMYLFIQAISKSDFIPLCQYEQHVLTKQRRIHQHFKWT